MSAEHHKLMKQAEKHFEKGKLHFARQCYEAILAAEPSHMEALNDLGVVLFHEGLIDDAIDHFQAVLGVDETNADALANMKMVEQYLQTAIEKPKKQGTRRNVGFISIWFERGQSYVTKTIRDALAAVHETFLFARTGGVYGKPMLETSGQWAVPNMTLWDRYEIPRDVIIRWVHDNRLDSVILNEEYDWDLVKALKSTGIKVITYLDYYRENWKVNMGLYDAVLCSTKRTFHLVKDICRAHYIGWGVDTDLFRPPKEKQEHTFFHNAGWLGINFRKMTPAAIAAFDAVSKIMPHVTLFVHSQAKLDLLPPIVVDIVRNNGRIVFHEETVPVPGFYHKGRIMLFPTKLEGLGLPLFEALACGLPVIATNAPPMNEFIREGYNGALIKVAFRSTREDNVAFQEEIIDMTDLAIKMAKMANDEENLSALSANARRYAEEELAFPILKKRISDAFRKVLEA